MMPIGPLMIEHRLIERMIEILRAEAAQMAESKVGTTVLLEGRLIRRKGKVAFMQGLALKASDRSVVAEAEASFMIVSEE